MKSINQNRAKVLIKTYLIVLSLIVMFGCGNYLYDYKNEDTSIATLKVEYKKTPATSLTTSKDTAPPVIRIDSPITSVDGELIVNEKTIIVKGQAVDASGVVHVLINGKEAELRSDGTFQIQSLLSVGINHIQIVAMDPLENEAKKQIQITRKADAEKTASPVSIPSGNFYALIIGNNKYNSLPYLETAVRDAKDVARVLSEKYHFQTELVLNASRDDIMRALNAYRRLLTENDSFLLYYAGHGIFDQSAKKAFWLPYDAVLNDDTNWIIADRITSNLNRFEASHILVIADSCYSGTLTRGIQPVSTQIAQRDRYLEKMKHKRSRTLISSGGNEPVWDSGGGSNSVFAKSLLQALSFIDYKMFTAEELFYQHIKEQVAGNADQTPEYKIIRNSGHNGGDFVFYRK